MVKRSYGLGIVGHISAEGLMHSSQNNNIFIVSSDVFEEVSRVYVLKSIILSSRFRSRHRWYIEILEIDLVIFI